MNETVSVIVPVCNVEAYLEECVDSILKQTYTNLEIILVDDGSKDRSGAICDELAGKDSRIQVIHKENGGLSSARNEGILKSRGEYLCFIDSDDCIKNNFVETLLSGCGRNCKMAVCSLERFKDGEAYSLEPVQKDIKGEVTDPYSFAEGLYDLISEEYVVTVIAMNKMYHRSLFEDIKYPTGRLHEDEFVIYHLAVQCECIYVTDAPLYLYRQRENSITGSKNRLDINHIDALDAYEIRIMEALECGDILTAEITIRNCLIKIIQYKKELKSVKYMPDILHKRYRNVYNKYGYILNTRRRLKYRLLKFVC